MPSTSYAFTPAQSHNIAKAALNAVYHVGAAPSDFHGTFTTLVNILNRSRPWFKRESTASDLHPAVRRVLLSDDLRHYVADWREMVLEWPHVSDSDELKIAYTRNDADGERDRQTVTSIGKYLKRHAPTMPDHDIRDLVALYTPDNLTLSFDLQDIIRAAQEGPRSCMQSTQWDTTDHPYNVYAPEYGWGIALRTDTTGAIVGRCLVNVADTDNKHFVRSYARTEGYSETDQAIEAWLKSQGFTRESAWAEGLKLAMIPKGRSYLMPYLDGDIGNVACCGDFFRISEDGGYDAKNTHGLADEINLVTCQHCDNEIDTDDDWCDQDGDYVCSSCLDYRYTYAVGFRGESEYVHNEDTIETVEGDFYVSDYLSDNNIVELHNGDYTHLDNAVYIDGEYYHSDDEGSEFVALANDYDGESYAIIENAWQCDVTGDWYHLDDDSVERYRVDDDQSVCPEGLASLLNQRDDYRASRRAIMSLEAERDALSQKLTHAETERDALSQKLTHAETERDALSQKLTHAETERDALSQKLTHAETERDALSQKLTHAETERDVALHKALGADFTLVVTA